MKPIVVPGFDSSDDETAQITKNKLSKQGGNRSPSSELELEVEADDADEAKGMKPMKPIVVPGFYSSDDEKPQTTKSGKGGNRSPSPEVELELEADDADEATLELEVEPALDWGYDNKRFETNTLKVPKEKDVSRSGSSVSQDFELVAGDADDVRPDFTKQASVAKGYLPTPLASSEDEDKDPNPSQPMTRRGSARKQSILLASNASKTGKAKLELTELDSSLKVLLQDIWRSSKEQYEEYFSRRAGGRPSRFQVIWEKLFSKIELYAIKQLPKACTATDPDRGEILGKLQTLGERIKAAGSLWKGLQGLFNTDTEKRLVDLEHAMYLALHDLLQSVGVGPDRYPVFTGSATEKFAPLTRMGELFWFRFFPSDQEEIPYRPFARALRLFLRADCNIVDGPVVHDSFEVFTNVIHKTIDVDGGGNNLISYEEWVRFLHCFGPIQSCYLKARGVSKLNGDVVDWYWRFPTQSDRKAAEEYLRKYPEKKFIVRKSENHPNLVVTCLRNNNILNWKITNDSSDSNKGYILSIDQVQEFYTIRDVLEGVLGWREADPSAANLEEKKVLGPEEVLQQYQRFFSENEIEMSKELSELNNWLGELDPSTVEESAFNKVFRLRSYLPDYQNFDNNKLGVPHYVVRAAIIREHGKQRAAWLRVLKDLNIVDKILEGTLGCASKGPRHGLVKLKNADRWCDMCRIEPTPPFASPGNSYSYGCRECQYAFCQSCYNIMKAEAEKGEQLKSRKPKERIRYYKGLITYAVKLSWPEKVADVQQRDAERQRRQETVRTVIQHLRGYMELDEDKQRFYLAKVTDGLFHDVALVGHIPLVLESMVQQVTSIAYTLSLSASPPPPPYQAFQNAMAAYRERLHNLLGQDASIAPFRETLASLWARTAPGKTAERSLIGEKEGHLRKHKSGNILHLLCHKQSDFTVGKESELFKEEQQHCIGIIVRLLLAFARAESEETFRSFREEVDHNGCTPLIKAIELDNKIWRTLQHHQANVHAVDSQHNTMLHYAAQKWNLRHFKELVKTLRGQKELKVNAVNTLGRTPLLSVLARHGPAVGKIATDLREMVLYLLQIGSQTVEKFEPYIELLSAIVWDQLSRLKDDRERLNKIPLRAIKNGDLTLCEILFKRSTTRQLEDIELMSESLLCAACDPDKCVDKEGRPQRRADIVSLILTHTLNLRVNYQDKQNKSRTALITAVQVPSQGKNRLTREKDVRESQQRDFSERAVSASIVNLLLHHEVDVHLKDRYDLNVLHYACLYNQVQIVSLLSNVHMDLDVAIKSDHIHQLDKFKGKASPAQGQTALHIAAYYGHWKIVYALLKAECAVDGLDTRGYTPLSLALKSRHEIQIEQESGVVSDDCQQRIYNADIVIDALLKHNASIVIATQFNKLDQLLDIERDFLGIYDKVRIKDELLRHNEEKVRRTEALVEGCLTKGVCTLKESTREFPLKQPSWECITCKKAVCVICKLICHRGHLLEPRDPALFFCSCSDKGEDTCRGRPGSGQSSTWWTQTLRFGNSAGGTVSMEEEVTDAIRYFREQKQILKAESGCRKNEKDEIFNNKQNMIVIDYVYQHHVKARHIAHLLKYLFFLIVLTVLGVYESGGRDKNSAFFFSQALSSYYVTNTFDKDISPQLKNFQGINGVDEWWFFVFGGFLTTTYPSVSYYKGDTLVNPTYGHFIDGNMRLIGTPRFRQIRSKLGRCDFTAEFQQGIRVDECMAFSDHMVEDTAAWGPDLRYTWQSAETLQGASYWGTYQWYSGGGYVVDFPSAADNLTQAADQALALATQLQEDGWVDAKTRAIFVEFNVFNPSSNLFAVCTMLLEAPIAGGLVPSWYFDIQKVKQYVSREDHIVMVLEIFTFALVLIYLTNSLGQLVQQGFQHFENGYNRMNFATFVLFGILVILFVHSIVLEEGVDWFQTDGFVPLARLAQTQDWFCCTYSVLVLLLWAKLLEYMAVYEKISRLTVMIELMVAEMASFLILFVIALVAFSSAEYIAYGYLDPVSYTWLYGFLNRVGDTFTAITITTPMSANRVMGGTFSILFLLSVVLLMLNLIIAILTTAYENGLRNIGEQYWARKQYHWIMNELGRKQWSVGWFDATERNAQQLLERFQQWVKNITETLAKNFKSEEGNSQTELEYRSKMRRANTTRVSGTNTPHQYSRLNISIQ